MPQIDNFATHVLSAALADLAAGIRETSPNDGPEIRLYAKRFGLVPPLNWCAVAASSWVLAAAREMGGKTPIVGSPAAQGVMGQLLHAQLWTPIAVLRNDPALADLVLCPGNLIIWKRPPATWTGHIGVVEYQETKHILVTIEGNSGPRGDRVARMKRDLRDANLLGFGRLDMVQLASAVAAERVEPVCKGNPIPG